MAAHDYELFVCERYRPMVGWSSDYLLPTDKHAYRIRGCKKSWRSAAEVEEALLAPGWQWANVRDESGNNVGWEVAPQGQQVDGEGWSYGASFPTNFEGSAKAGLQKFARWRRLARTQTFTVDGQGLAAAARASAPSREPPPERICPNVDLAAAARLGRSIAEAIASASLYGEWSELALVQLKRQVLQILLDKPPKEKETFESMLSGFINSHRGVATRIGEAFTSPADTEIALAARLTEVDERFPANEREAFATLAIWRYKPEFACAPTQQEHECEFQPVACKNPGCTERCSAKALEAHDKMCGRKVLPCQKCGEEIHRGEINVHNAVACPMREARCTFGAIGCEVPLAHAKIDEHLEQCTQAHMMLLMRGMLEQQELVKQLQIRVADLEAQNRELLLRRESDLTEQARVVASLATQVTAADAKVAELEKKHAKEVKDLKKAADDGAGKSQKRAEDADKDAKKRHEALEKAHTANMETLRSDFAALKATVAELRPVREEVLALKATLAGKPGAGGIAVSGG